MAETPSHLKTHVAHLPYSRPPTPSVQPLQIGFIGLGAMGYKMARNLARHEHSHPKGSHPLLVYNRSRSKAEQLLKELGDNRINIADNVEQLATECDVVFSSLGSDEAVQNVYNTFAEALKHTMHDRPKIFVETSTIYPSVAGNIDKSISKIPHTHFVACPVFGPPAAAEAAQLILVLAGDYRSKKEVAYLLVPAVGRKVYDLGGNVEKASTFKLVGNSLILGWLEIMSESMTLADKAGIGANQVLDLISDFGSGPMANYGAKIVNDQFDGTKGFAIDGGIKDASHMRRLTGELNCPMPTVDSAYQHLLTARALHDEHQKQGKEKFEVLDWSAMVAGARVSAGLDPFDSQQRGVVRE